MQALEFSRRYHLEHVDVERLIGDDPFKPTILVLERLYLGDIADFHAAEFRLPGVERRRTDAVLAAQILGCDARFVLFEDADDLRFAEPRFLHDGVSSRPVASEFSTYFRSLFRATRHVLLVQSYSDTNLPKPQ